MENKTNFKQHLLSIKLPRSLEQTDYDRYHLLKDMHHDPHFPDVNDFITQWEYTMRFNPERLDALGDLWDEWVALRNIDKTGTSPPYHGADTTLEVYEVHLKTLDREAYRKHMGRWDMKLGFPDARLSYIKHPKSLDAVLEKTSDEIEMEEIRKQEELEELENA